MTSLRWPSSADLDALIVSSKFVFSWLPLFQCLFNGIEHGIQLRTSGSPVAVAANALADALVVTTFPSGKTEAVINLMALEMGGASSFIDILKHAFWTDNALSGITLFRFVGEFKRAPSSKNVNQLLMDFATGQCQLRALGIREIIWGATYSLGVAKVFSSEWNINGSVSNVSSLSRRTLLT